MIFNLSEYPNVTFLCDDDVNEDEMFTCICKKSDKSNLTTEVRWYSNDLIVSNGSDTAILHQIAHKNLTGKYSKCDLYGDSDIKNILNYN